MEMALNMGKFEELDQNEMYEIDGGLCWEAVALIVIGGIFVAGVITGLCGG